MLAAQTPGITLRDLMARMGHDSERAALIYQHATRVADRGIAEALGRALADHDQSEDQDGGGEDGEEGSAGVPVRVT